MPLVSMLDLENTIKIEQLILNQANFLENHSINSVGSNFNLMLENKVALINQLQQQAQQNSKLLTSNLLLNTLKANLNAQTNQALTNLTCATKQINYSRYKTELCRQFNENGECKYGEKCQFAHGFNDLKDVNRHPKYKTDFCKTFHSKGFCPYGPRCHFIHEINEKPEAQAIGTSRPTIDIKKAQQQTIQNSNLSPKSKINALNELNQIDKQIEEIQGKLATSLFVHDDSNDLKSSEKKEMNKPDNEALTLDELQKSFNYVSPGLSGQLSPIISNTSCSSSATVSSSTSPTLSSKIEINLPIKANNISGDNNVSKISPNIDNKLIKSEPNEIENIFAIRNNNILLSQSSSPPSPSLRTRSNTSSTSSACSAISASSYETQYESNQFIRLNNNNIQENKLADRAISSPVIQQPQRSLIRNINDFYANENRVGLNESNSGVNLGPISRPASNSSAQMLSPQSAKNLLLFSNMILQNSDNSNQFLKNDFNIFNAINRHVNW